jgi:recombination protein RecR
MAENKKYIEDLISALTCLPGVGKKTAQRMTYHLLQRGKEDALNLSHVLEDVVTNIKNCKTCRNLCHSEECDVLSKVQQMYLI